MKVAAALIEDVCHALGRNPPLHRRTLDFYRTDVVYDTARARQTLQWTARVNLDEGLRRTLDWYRERKLIA
jgi:nucleoside-diphosphate-sugar epimerase